MRGPSRRAAGAAAGARPRVERLVDRLLPHRPLARRPGEERAAARALPQRGDHLAARHRPRLPARRARGAAPARARALRPRPLGARRRVPDVQVARRDPRARQGARPAAGRDRARRARRRRRGAPTSAATSTSRSATASAARGRWAWLDALAAEAQGLPRHLSQHSGGMIVATRPLVDCCPVVPAAMTGRQMVHWDKDSCSDAGFLKIDLLGLGMLSAVERCVDLIAAAHGGDHRPLADPVRRPRDVRVDPGGRHHRRLPDREPRADGVAAAHAARDARGDHDPGRDRAARPDPGRRGQPVHRAPPAPARGPGRSSCPTSTRRSSRC